MIKAEEFAKGEVMKNSCAVQVALKDLNYETFPSGK
jgi:hypothetical protein